ncbi:hypothetical protein [Ruania halotolerans]|uniref:hypothetical protein n=1 Tax=Ruania halotolerans TaxID=2897773 RepID=UPI001E3EA99E|nr:hypothetical protein [Ruania halotolerans]UFU07110.1 hypothetical protein LQF10_03080 [Ruania halotolerans]
MTRASALSVLDSALHQGRADAATLRRVKTLVRGRRGAARTHEYWDLVDGRAESPLETRARLIFHDADVAPDELQVPLRNADGAVMAYGDMGWRLADGTWLIVEMDGREVHAAPEAVYRDRARQNEVLAAGRTLFLRFTGADLGRHQTMVAQVRRSLARGTAAVAA